MEKSQPLFRIKKHETSSNGFQAYWIESSAPLNVDDKEEKAADEMDRGDPVLKAAWKKLKDMPDPDEAIKEIADYLNGCENPQLVISIHGFNNPAPVVLDRYTKAFHYLSGDPSIMDRAGLVCIGYRWPSEKIAGPRSSILDAAPRGLIWVFGVALAMLGTGAGLSAPRARPLPGRNALHSLLYALGSLLVAVPFTAFLMRISAYFRDAYRAVNYGVPDLLDFIRRLDKAVGKEHTTTSIRPTGSRIKLSFIGHSMGAFVVTNLVRILSDVFSPESMTNSASDSASSSAVAVGKTGDKDEQKKLHWIGNVYTLERLVLVSPDIPAETLLQGRANFLQVSLGRFREAYLFSNEGDEALRLISTIANYFSFPTTDRKFGYRLGNVNIMKPPPPGRPEYGIVNLKRLRDERPSGETCLPPGTPWTEAQQFLCDLGVGNSTLAYLNTGVTTTTEDDRAADDGDHKESPLPARFTYFDCTDYIDSWVRTDGREGKVMPIMTFAKRKASLSDWDHFRLLCSYLFSHRADKPDGHSGYFSAPFTQCLIYRLSCLGLEDTLNSVPPLRGAESGLGGWSAACKERQIQALLSPLHYELFVPSGKEQEDR